MQILQDCSYFKEMGCRQFWVFERGMKLFKTSRWTIIDHIFCRSNCWMDNSRLNALEAFKCLRLLAVELCNLQWVVSRDCMHWIHWIWKTSSNEIKRKAICRRWGKQSPLIDWPKFISFQNGPVASSPAIHRFAFILERRFFSDLG